MRLPGLVVLAMPLLAMAAQGPAPREDSAPVAGAADQPVVVILHGLGRSASSMDRMARALRGKGYRVCNIPYPSRKHSIGRLAAEFVAPAIVRCDPDPSRPVHFVTHSLGGIIVRELARTGLVRNFGRVVMLGPPNHGSEVVDAIGDWQLFAMVNGPAGAELGTSPYSTPRQLGPAAFQPGIIAGNRSINWINSMLIPGVDDGKVSLESAKLEGMRDFVIVKSSHPLLMNNRTAIAQTLRFLASGCFSHGPEPVTSGAAAPTPAPSSPAPAHCAG